MQKAALIYNPVSGRQRQRRLAEIEAAAAELRSAGVLVETIATQEAGSAGEQARQAAGSGYDTVFACGGDGTVNEVLQGLVGTEAALGVIPLGTANAFATDLGLPSKPAAAVRVALAGARRRLAVGRMEYCDLDGGSGARYFTVAAGIGGDAHLFYKMNLQLKQRMGMHAYYAQALHVWATHDFPAFEVQFTESESGRARQETVTQVLAVRITRFAGLLKRLAPGASLERDDLQLVLFKTASRVPFLLYMMNTFLERQWQVPGIELVHASSVACCPRAESAGCAKSKIYAEVDGELVGRVPLQISMVKSGVTLLMPRK